MGGCRAEPKGTREPRQQPAFPQASAHLLAIFKVLYCCLRRLRSGLEIPSTGREEGAWSKIPGAAALPAEGGNRMNEPKPVGVLVKRAQQMDA